MSRSTLTSYDTGDVTGHSHKIGINYNSAIDLLVEDGIIPMYDAPYTDIYKTDCTHPETAYGWSPDTCRLFLSFMEQEGLTEFRMQA